MKRPGAPPTMQVDWQLAVSERGPDGGMFPVPAAMVEVRRGQTVVFDGPTDPQGRLRTQLPSGQLQLTVRKGGYQTHQQPLEIQDKPRRTDVTLRRGQ